jgi:hypothetical protein
MMLFSYGGLNRESNTYGRRHGTGIADIEALKEELPGLFELAALVRNKPITGVHTVKPANSSPHSDLDPERTFSGNDADAYIYDFIGMLGIPLVPSEKVDTEAEAAFFSIQALKDPHFLEKLNGMLDREVPVLITDELAAHLKDPGSFENLIVLDIDIDPRNILRIDREELNSIRNRLLAPFGIRFDAPSMVAFYLIGDDLVVIENFSDQEAETVLEMPQLSKADVELVLPSNAEVVSNMTGNTINFSKIPPRTLIAIEYE